MHYKRLTSTGNVGDAQPQIRAQGDGTVMHEGYIGIQVNGRRTLLHRLVMEEQLGRSLRPEEEVHHKNGIRHDNHPKNLELWTSSHPSGQRVEDLVAWARDLLARYGEEFPPC